MGKYHSNRGPVEGCPQPEPRRVNAGDLVYVQQRPSRTCGPGQLRWQPMSDVDLAWAREQARKVGVRV